MITICRFPVLAKVFDTFTGTYLFWEETKNIAFERNQGRGNCFKVFLQISKYVYVEKLGSSRQPTHSPSLLAGDNQPQLKSLRNRQICRLKSVKKNRNRVEKQSLSFWRITFVPVGFLYQLFMPICSLLSNMTFGFFCLLPPTIYAQYVLCLDACDWKGRGSIHATFCSSTMQSEISSTLFL